jgi:hypothetical protein
MVFRLHGLHSHICRFANERVAKLQRRLTAISVRSCELFINALEIIEDLLVDTREFK